MQLSLPSFLHVGSVLPAHSTTLQKDFFREVTSTDHYICNLLKRAGCSSTTTVSCSHMLVPAISVTLEGGRKYRAMAMRRWMLTPRARRRARGVKRRWMPRRSCMRMGQDERGRSGLGGGPNCICRLSFSSSPSGDPPDREVNGLW